MFYLIWGTATACAFSSTRPVATRTIVTLLPFQVYSSHIMRLHVLDIQSTGEAIVPVAISRLPAERHDASMTPSSRRGYEPSQALNPTAGL